jgi:hypothetical protein
VRQHWARQEAVVTYEPMEQHPVITTGREETVARVPVQGVSATDLMGEKGALVGLRDFPLFLPYSPTEWRVTRLCEIQSATT